ncbi:MAG: hypothetical protein NT007_13935 [Candidatus Kapabacteria bacterium]|nr:hypothetical protein [Candidatus Kapabacteria bacterium]
MKKSNYIFILLLFFNLTFLNNTYAKKLRPGVETVIDVIVESIIQHDPNEDIFGDVPKRIKEKLPKNTQKVINEIILSEEKDKISKVKKKLSDEIQNWSESDQDNLVETSRGMIDHSSSNSKNLEVMKTDFTNYKDDIDSLRNYYFSIINKVYQSSNKQFSEFTQSSLKSINELQDSLKSTQFQFINELIRQTNLDNKNLLNNSLALSAIQRQLSQKDSINIVQEILFRREAVKLFNRNLDSIVKNDSSIIENLKSKILEVTKEKIYGVNRLSDTLEKLLVDSVKQNRIYSISLFNSFLGGNNDSYNNYNVFSPGASLNISLGMIQPDLKLLKHIGVYGEYSYPFFQTEIKSDSIQYNLNWSLNYMGCGFTFSYMFQSFDIDFSLGKFWKFGRVVNSENTSFVGNSNKITLGLSSNIKSNKGYPDIFISASYLFNEELSKTNISTQFINKTPFYFSAGIKYSIFNNNPIILLK